MKLLKKVLAKVSILIHNSYAKTSQINVKDKKKIHYECLIENAYIHGDVEIKSGVIISKGVHISGKVSIGKNTSISGPNTDLYSEINKITIGNFCSIARNVSFQEYFHKSDRITTYMINSLIFKSDIKEDITSKGDIVVGNDVWIGTHCVILSGVKIGNGAIIGSNSVVNRDVPDYAIVAGSPARIIKYRFEQLTIDLLNEVKWWNWDDNKIKQNNELFLLNSENEIINKLKEITLE
jgi:virginiamycin A acetyltransferase